MISHRSEIYFWKSTSHNSLIKISSSIVISRFFLTFFNTCSNTLLTFWKKLVWKWSVVGCISTHNVIQRKMGFVKSMGRQMYFSTSLKTYITNKMQLHIYTSIFYFIYTMEDSISSTMKYFSSRGILVNWYPGTTVLLFF